MGHSSDTHHSLEQKVSFHSDGISADSCKMALRYLAEGFSVIPIHRGAKEPIFSWRTFQERRPSSSEIERWFSTEHVNIGIVCGNVSRGLVVLDFDGERWKDGYDVFILEHPQIMKGRIVETGSGRRHIWVRVLDLPSDISLMRYDLNGARVELRANGHYVLAPPSIHPSGRPYRFVNLDNPILEIRWPAFSNIVEWFPSNDKILVTKERLECHEIADEKKQRAASEYYFKRAVKCAKPGNRNETGLWLACQLRDSSLSEHEAKPFMLRYAKRVPQEDQRQYTADEALATLKSTYRRPPREPAIPRAISKKVKYKRAILPSGQPIEDAELDHEIIDALVKFRRTDAGNAESFKEIFGDQFCYVLQEKKWFRWNGIVWASDDEGAQVAMIETARLRHRAAVSLTDTDKKDELEKWARRSEFHYNIRAALSLAKAMLKKDITDFDCDPYLLPCSNGVVNLKTGELRPARAQDYLHRCTNVLYDPTAVCPRWESFLDEIFNDDQKLVEFVHRSIGYTLTGIASEQCLFILHGTGQNGKSTLLTVIENLLGEFATPTPPNMLKNTRWDTIPTDVAKMYGKRLIKAIEVRENISLNEEKIKALTGEDKISARELYKGWFDFIPIGKIWWAVNHKPVIRGTDEAIWRRIHLIPFEVQFPKGKRDPNLKKTLQEELSGILAWAVRGCLEWQKGGLDPPQVVQHATSAYRQESDIIEQFLEECTILKRETKVQASRLYETYKHWCKDNGEKEISGTRFGKKMAEKGFEKQKNGCNYYLGIELLPEYDRSGV